jgi:N-acetylglucosamine kinase-like BadF-type ATPase
MELRALLSKYVRMPFEALTEAIEKDGIPAIEAAIAQQVLKAAQKGDAKAFQFLLDYAGCRPETGVTIAESPAQLALDSMTTAELLDVVRKTLPAAADLPDIKPTEEPKVE